MHLTRLSKAAILLALISAGPAEAGLYSRKATALADIHGSLRPMTVSAPDNRTRAVARFNTGKDDGTLTVYLGVRGGFQFPGGPAAEMLWSPDSRTLAVTYDYGEDGLRSAILVRHKPRGWGRVNLSEAVAKVYRQPAGCTGMPDVATLGWTSGRRLIVAATPRPQEGCAARRRFTAYVVNVPDGRVLMEMDQHEAEHRYRAMLGRKLAPPHHHRKRHHHRR